MQRWVQTYSSNQGLHLSSTGAPVQLVSIESARSTPALMPVLDLVTSPDPVVRPRETTWGNLISPNVAGIGDGVPFIYGAAGTFLECVTTNHICGNGGPTALSAVATRSCTSGVCTGFGGSLIRYPANLACGGINTDWSSVWQLMSAADARHLISIVDFVPPSAAQCGAALTPQQWHDQLMGFVQGAPTLPTVNKIYFEIGNEEDIYQPQYGNDYNSVFFNAAAGLYWTIGSKYPFYRILVGGMLYAEAIGCSPNTVPQADAWIANSQNTAYPGRSRGLNPLVLGLAMHPYGYTASDVPSFPNSGFPQSTCLGLDTTISYINFESHLANKPIVFSEVNYSATRLDPTFSRKPAFDAAGRYLADLFSYLYDRCGFASFTCTTGPIIPANSPLRVMWFRGNDVMESVNGVPKYDPLGLYDDAGAEKLLPAMASCPYQGDHLVNQTQSHAYYYLRNGHCW